MDRLDFNMLNAISKHQKVALDFCFSSDENLFVSDDARKLGKAFITYINTFKSRPSKKVMLDRHSTDDVMIDLVTQFFDKAETIDYNEPDYKYDLGKLKQRFGELKLQTIHEKLSKSNFQDIKENLKFLQKDISEIKALEGVKAFERCTLDNYVDKFRESYKEKAQNPELGKGLLTGYSFLDYIKNGLRPSDLIIIAAETGGGKSMLMSNMAVQMWLQSNTVDTPADKIKPGCNVAYFSLEMPYEDCFQRAMSRIADVPSYGIRDAKLSKAEAQGLSKACKFMKRYPYKFDIIDVPRGFSVEQLEVMYEEMTADYKPDVLFIDYMGLMEDIGDDSDDWLALGKLAGKIHEFGRTYSIPIVTAVQLNRLDPQHKGNAAKAIGLHRIGRSALISTHASMVIQIESRPDEETHDDFVYHIIKNRHGASGGHASVYKNFQKCSIIDKPYDIEAVETWATSDDISEDVSDILSAL